MNLHPDARPGAKVLVLLVFVNLLVGGVGGASTVSSVGSWYQALAKPSWNPPNWVFGPVWTTLYILIAVAAWQALRGAPSAARRSLLGLYALQMALNGAWSFSFFYLQSPMLGFVNILLLDAAALACALHFRKVSRPAFLLFLPYLAWIFFASVLNGTIWFLNSGG